MQTEKRVIALGFFDGVHLGHGALLRRVGEKGKGEFVPISWEPFLRRSPLTPTRRT